MTVSLGYSKIHILRIDRIESAIITAAVGSQTNFPVDLSRVIDLLGADVRFASCRSAYTYFQPSGPVIHLRSAEPSKERQNFVLAH